MTYLAFQKLDALVDALANLLIGAELGVGLAPRDRDDVAECEAVAIDLDLLGRIDELGGERDVFFGVRGRAERRRE